MNGCPDCAKVADDVPPLRTQCAYHDMITGGDADPFRQALAISVDPEAFEKAAETHHYLTLAMPLKPDKLTAYEARAIAKAYAAADRVMVLVQ